MQTRLFRLALLCTMMMAYMSSFAQKKTPFFVQISDPQLCFISSSNDFTAEKELMGRITEKVNKLKPDFVVFSGDMVHWTDNAASLDGFKQMCSEFDKDIPLYFVPGNHDVTNDATKENVEAFVARYGHDRFVHKEKGYTVIGYNS